MQSCGTFALMLRLHFMRRRLFRPIFVSFAGFAAFWFGAFYLILIRVKILQKERFPWVATGNGGVLV